jgi:hypothetical protein
LTRGRTLAIAFGAALATACGPASALGAQRVEAERMHVAPAAGHVARDASASSHHVLVLVGVGTARATVKVRARSTLRVVARGDRCSGAPRLVAAINGSRVLSHRVTARRRWAVVWATGAVAAGTQRITLRLANPHRGRGCRRRLRVDRLVLSPAAAANPAPAPSPPGSSSTGRWVPAPRTTWQWQLTGTVDQSVDAQMFDIDLFDNAASVVAALHARGRHVVCYLDAGTYEPGRPDSASYPAAVKGKELPDWPGEQWLDVRRLDLLGPILQRRFDLCKQKGFDAVEPDNIDGYANDSGFPLTADDQLKYNRFLADAAHARGLSIGLKNDLDQVGALQPSFDWALNEQCFQYSECDTLRPFAAAGKAVFITEYELAVGSFCPQANAAGYMAMRKRLALDAWRETCW